MSSNSTVPINFISPTALYGYIPTFWICCMFLTLFSITTFIHFIEALIFKPRLYWLIPTTVMCGIGEIIGWSARLWSSKNPINGNAFLMQISTTIIAPVFLTAALYTILGLVIDILGFQYSRLKPKTYLKIFVTADVFALLVQATGGGLASGSNNKSGSNLGSNIMLAGIFIQMAAMLCYTFLATEFMLRVYLQKPLRRADLPSTPSSSESFTSDKVPKYPSGASADSGVIIPTRISLMVLGLALATVLVFVRTFYRTVELLGGWRGHIIRTQIFFNLLDATPIVIALFVLNFLSPAFLLRKKTHGTF